MNKLDDFTLAYIEAALWSTNDESDESGGEPLDKNYSVSDISEETLSEMVADCAKFQADNAELLTDEFCLTGLPADEQGGHDFWLTRCGHGVGFWETFDWEESAGKKLTASAKGFGNVDLYLGDDGQIYS